MRLTGPGDVLRLYLWLVLQILTHPEWNHLCAAMCVCFVQGYNGKGNNWHWQPYDVKDNRDDSIFCDPQCPFTRFSLPSPSRPFALPLVWALGFRATVFGVLCCQLVVFKMTLKTAK